ncbi:Ku protein [Noviherbaspirillum humi]|uniref:Ku protein n=1 Tax=Noviherbaspirillum humi TaxID=1688639 RepID=A0A239DSQ9_9BURK|nr:Ku protein [Noviherbaspirillum humi]
MIVSSEKWGACHSVDIFAFVAADDIPLSQFEAPFYLTPAPGEERDYHLLHETLNRTGKVGIAHVVIRQRQQLAALIPCGPALILNTLRWDIGQGDDMMRHEPGGPELSKQDLETACRLVDSMTRKWDIGQYHPAFRDDILSLVRRRVRSGEPAAMRAAADTDAQYVERVRPRPPAPQRQVDALPHRRAMKPRYRRVQA